MVVVVVEGLRVGRRELANLMGRGGEHRDRGRFYSPHIACRLFVTPFTRHASV